MVRCTTPPDLLGRNSRTRSSRDSRLEEAGFELFVPLGISTSSSWWSRSRKPHGAPKGSFSVAEPKVRIQLSPAERCYGAGGEDGNFVAYINRWSASMSPPNDLSRSLVPLDQDSTIIAVVEMSQSSWLVGGVLPGIES